MALKSRRGNVCVVFKGGVDLAPHRKCAEAEFDFKWWAGHSVAHSPRRCAKVTTRVWSLALELRLIRIRRRVAGQECRAMQALLAKLRRAATGE